MRPTATAGLVANGLVYAVREEIVEMGGDEDGATISNVTVYAPTLRGHRAIKHWHQMRRRGTAWFGE